MVGLGGRAPLFFFITIICYICDMKYLFLFALLLASCWTPKQRYDYLVSKYPDLIDTDTVVVMDTMIETYEVPVEEFHDSFIIQHDTIIETKKLVVTRKGNYFGVKVKPDTIIFRDTLTREVKVPGRILKKNCFSYERLIIIFILGVLLGLLLSFKYKKD